VTDPAHQSEHAEHGEQEPEPNSEMLEFAAKIFNLCNDKGDTLVMLAAYHGHPQAVSALLARGADPGRPNDRGQTPLAGAVFKGERAVIQVLLDGGADPTAGMPSAVETARMFGLGDLVALFEGR
jgi:ankyrin repeat protein